MPHIVTFDGLIARKAGPQRPDDFIKLGDIKGEFQADELTGNFNALNEATNVRPAKGESISIIHPQFRSGQITYREDGAKRANPTLHPGINPDSMQPVDFSSPEEHRGDSITGENNKLKRERSLSWHDVRDYNYGKFAVDADIWTNGGASTFKDRPIWTTGGTASMEDKSFGDYDFNDAVFSMRENLGVVGKGTFIPAGNEGWDCTCVPDLSFTKIFEPLAEMNNFGESLNPVLELSGTAGPGGTSFMTGQFDVPTDNVSLYDH